MSTSYLVTDLMATDLHTLLNTKKLDNQFTEYFLYQIMVFESSTLYLDRPSNCDQVTN